MRPSPIQLYYADHHEVLLPQGHRFPMSKYRMVRERLSGWPMLSLEQAPPITTQELMLAHEPDYVTRFIEGTLEPRAMRHIGLPWSSTLVARTLAACGGTLAAAHAALTAGIGGNLAGGTHHAFADHGEGFCVFNDQVVAIKALRAQGYTAKIAAVDLDVHQGNGTAAMLADDERCWTLSIHGARNYPFRKVPSSRDIGLEDKTDDQTYLDALIPALEEVWRWEPSLIFYQAGVDALATDTLGRLAMTHQGLIERDRLVLMGAHRRNIPIVLTLGGGYANPIEDSVQAYTHTYEVAVEVFGQ